MSADLFESVAGGALGFQRVTAASRSSLLPNGVAAFAATRRATYPDVVGLWVGSAKTVGKKRGDYIDIRITRQTGAGATGKFGLGPVTTWHRVLSTAVLSAGRDRSFKVILRGDDFYGSVTAAVSKNGQQIVGRWACNGPAGWKTGTLVLNRQ
jgi:hypothetical protein